MMIASNACVRFFSAVPVAFLISGSAFSADFDFENYAPTLGNDSVYELTFTKSDETDYNFVSYEEVGGEWEKVHYKYIHEIKAGAAVSHGQVTGGTGGADLDAHFYGLSNSAVYNVGNVSIGNISGDFVGNYQGIFNSGGGGSGGSDTGELGDVTGDFIGNDSSTDDGGAIYNYGYYRSAVINSISGNFIGNRTSYYGGAISNYGVNAVIGDVSGNFIGNSSQVGGAIYNRYGTIGDIRGDFIGNETCTTAHACFGGAIYNESTGNDSDISTIGSIFGDFIGNSSGRGGAIYNSTGIMEAIAGNFVGNSSVDGGGAIYNFKDNTAYLMNNNVDAGVIGNITGNFIRNSSGSFGGGAIINMGNGNQVIASIGDITGSFIENSTPGYGGAIYSTSGALGNIAGDFYKNSAGSSGGAIASSLTAIRHITGSFTENTSAVDGGAIVSYGSPGYWGGTIGEINGDFIRNSAARNGGAIYSSNTVTGNISGNFIENSALSFGGAVVNLSTSYDTDIKLTFVNSNFIDNSVSNPGGSGYGGAIYSQGGDIDIVADNGSSLFSGNTANGESNAFYMNSNLHNGVDTIKYSTLTLESRNRGVITIDDGIDGGKTTAIDDGQDHSYKIEFKGDSTGTVNLNGKVSNAEIIGGEAGLPASGTVVNISHADNINNSNSLTLNNGIFNIFDLGQIQLHFNNAALSGGTLNIRNTDVDLAALSMGRISADDYQSGAASVRVGKISVVTDGGERNVVGFVDSAIAGNVVSGVSESRGPVYNYGVSYDSGTGEFIFTRRNVNSAVQVPAVAAAAAVSVLSDEIYSRVLADVDSLFTEQAERVQSHEIARPFIKTFGSDESIDLKNFEDVDSRYYGLIGGIESGRIDKSGGWSAVYSAYLAYVYGKHEFSYDDVKQQGGYLGVGANFYKDDFFIGSTANIGIMHNKARTRDGNDSFDSYQAGVGVKLGYNHRLKDGLIVQPNLYGSYTYIDADSYRTDRNVKVDFRDIHNFELAPGLKVIKDFGKDLRGYARGRYVWIFNEGQSAKANGIHLPDVEMKDYVEYGLGLEKIWKGRDLSGFIEINRRDGGREGWSEIVGVKWNF